MNGGAASGKDKAAAIIQALMLEAEQELGKASAPTQVGRSSMLTAIAAPVERAAKATVRAGLCWLKTCRLVNAELSMLMAYQSSCHDFLSS